jgi:hypothetical protein
MLYENFKNILNSHPYIRCVREKQGKNAWIDTNTRRMAILPGGMAKPPRGMTNPSREMTNPSRGMTNPSREMTNPSRELTNPSREMTNPSREMTNPPGELIFPPVFLVICVGGRGADRSFNDFQHLNYKYIRKEIKHVRIDSIRNKIRNKKRSNHDTIKV